MVAILRYLPDEKATAALGADLAPALRPGDVIGLEGELGSGKTSLARAIIRALAESPDLEVPSPTFTLVQTYEARLPIAHFDLYRIAGPDELEELAPGEDPETVTLIEWPQRAGDRLPPEIVKIHLEHQGEGRLARIVGPEATLARIQRSLAARDFLERAGWPKARRSHLAGDASARSYEIIEVAGKEPAILMNAPPLVPGPPVRDGKPYADIAHISRDVGAFVAMDRLLAQAGFCVPPIHCQDLEAGFLVIGHLGAEGITGPAGEPIAERYEAAARLLADIHRRGWPGQVAIEEGRIHRIPTFDRDAMMIEVELLVDWYLPAVLGRQASGEERAGFAAAWTSVLDAIDGCETSLVLRDFHSPNLIWREERHGGDRLGLLDFQDALIGPAAYDVASLAMDARVTVPPELERQVVEAYVSERRAAGSFDRQAFDAAYAVMAAQRNSKCLGIFVRLHRRDGKPAYLAHLPRVRAYLRHALSHPVLAPVKDFYEEHAILEEPKP